MARQHTAGGFVYRHYPETLLCWNRASPRTRSLPHLTDWNVCAAMGQARIVARPSCRDDRCPVEGTLRQPHTPPPASPRRSPNKPPAPSPTPPCPLPTAHYPPMIVPLHGPPHARTVTQWHSSPCAAVDQSPGWATSHSNLSTGPWPIPAAPLLTGVAGSDL